MARVLYLFENRHPEELRNLVRSYLMNESIDWIEGSYDEDLAQISKKFSEVDAVLMAPGRYLSDQVHKAGKNIKLIQLWSSGYDKINLKACTKYGQKVSNNGGANSQSVAEHTFLLMLSVARRAPEMHNRVLDSNWKDNGHGLNLQSLFGKKLGIIGLGNIGSKVAKIASAFEMKISFFDPNIASAQYSEYRKLNLDELVSESEFISLHLHNKSDKSYLLGDPEFRQMKIGVNIINTSRSELIDLKSLKQYLESGRIRSYAADVFSNEPTEGHEIELQMKNIFYSPHIAGSNIETYRIALENCLANIKRALNGKEILWQVS